MKKDSNYTKSKIPLRLILKFIVVKKLRKKRGFKKPKNNNKEIKLAKVNVVIGMAFAAFFM